ncbi:hypothetical protein [Protaetiibacter larvae]|uniref:Uncharacterized protein n=1 Tax=Protaetiibacter larvae TaxID=2592654 RepID=A0A5C1Y9P4_9MICO|nr:hypothetical protein [Protaetiibacter larvae]QEO10644.1 hypothetical protein FLP23_11895 [Protaetiibacter larvae]
MSNLERIVSSAAAVALGAGVLVGCAASPAAFEESVPPALLAADANIVDSYLSFSQGPAGVGFWLRIYVTDTDDAAVAQAVEAAFAAAFRASPARPTDIVLDVAQAPRPSEVELFVGSIDLGGAAEVLGLSDKVIDDRITLSGDELAERYGEWTAAG